MKINHSRPSVPDSPKRGRLLAGGALALLLTGCASERAPLPPPSVATRPAPVVQPIVAPAPVAREPSDWRDRQLTAGDWNYHALKGGSVAQFSDRAGNGLVAIACDTGQRVVTLTRSAPNRTPGSTASIPLTVVTTALPHPYNAGISADSGQFGTALAISLRAGDSTLDDLAFSRGRFAIEASGQPTFILPAWEEVGRVIEDCR